MSELERIADQASQALQRGHDHDREKASLLDYLLGELQFYAENGATINYTVQLVDGMKPQKARRDVQALLDNYLHRRQAVWDKYHPKATQD